MPLIKKTSEASANTYKCPQCGYIKTKTGGGIVGAIRMSITPKCPKCKVKMELISQTR